MKKKTKNLLLLMVVLAVLVCGYFALDFIPEDTVEEEDAVTEPVEVTEFAAEDIAYYCYYNSAYEMGFDITEDGYTHYRDGLFPVNADSVDAQLAAVGNLTALQVVEGTDKAEYGLDSPRTTIAVTLKDGTERTFFIGDSALFEAADYLLDVENNVIYLVEEELYDEFNCDWSDMVQQEEKVLVSSEQILEVSVETAGVQTAHIVYDETKEQPWQLTGLEETFDGDSEAVLDAIDIFASYSLGTTIEYNCEDFAQYGLDAPSTTVTVRYTEESEEKTLVFEFGNVDEESSETYVRINGSSFVYGMSEYNAEGLSVFDLEAMRYQEEENTEETTTE